MIPYAQPWLDDDDRAAVARSLNGPTLTAGPNVERLEAALVDLTGAAFAVAFSSGTAALFATLQACELRPGVRGVTSALTFAASATSMMAANAQVTTVDVDPRTLNMDLRSVPGDAEVVVAVHYAGLPLDLSELPGGPRIVIEDAAHAIGAVGPHGRIGNCARSHACCFSFHPTKVVTSGEGGAVTTNSQALAQRLRQIRSHGLEPRPDWGPGAMEVVRPGQNLRMSELHAALGVSQLAKLDRFLRHRDLLWELWSEGLAPLAAARRRVTLPADAPAGQRHGRHLYVLRVPALRDHVRAALAEAGFGTQVHYPPLTEHRGLRIAGPSANAWAAWHDALSLPLHYGVSPSDVERAVDCIRHRVRSPGHAMYA